MLSALPRPIMGEKDNRRNYTIVAWMFLDMCYDFTFRTLC